MNVQVQFLQKQIARRDAQIQMLLMALDGCERQLEAAESLACAFAWDLSNNINAQRGAADNFYSDPAYNAAVAAVDGIEEDVLSMWEAATVFGSPTATEVAVREQNK